MVPTLCCMLVGSTIPQYKQLPWYFLVHTVGGQCNGNCVPIYVHATHANYIYMGSIHYIARIAVISNCAGWQLVYFQVYVS